MSEAPKPEWWFYHLSRTTLEQAAAPLVQKCLDAGWRVLAVSPSPDRLAALDSILWTFDEKTFLPHGQAEALVLMDGTKAPVDAPYTRCMVMFDDGDTDTRNLARQQFKAAKDAGLVTRYFQQTPSGGWKEAGK